LYYEIIYFVAGCIKKKVQNSCIGDENIQFTKRRNCKFYYFANRMATSKPVPTPAPVMMAV
jgi:hypothetical protein